ncbi:hypothetical protein NFI96_025529 [Prochilodus magdalenae]|nr:hypothetical protein NFI96_025529 [Prochilodus magdalenae]
MPQRWIITQQSLSAQNSPSLSRSAPATTTPLAARLQQPERLGAAALISDSCLIPRAPRTDHFQNYRALCSKLVYLLYTSTNVTAKTMAVDYSRPSLQSETQMDDATPPNSTSQETHLIRMRTSIGHFPKWEKKLCRHFSRIVIRGKRGRPVPVLLTPKMKCTRTPC